MTVNNLIDRPGFPFNIRYVDPPVDAHSVRRHRAAVAGRRIAFVMLAAVAILLAGTAFSLAARPLVVPAADGGPVRGEYRLAPGLQQPPGYVVPLSERPVTDEPDVQWRPSLIPDQGGVSLAIPKGDIIFAPTPPGRVPTA